MQMVIVLLVIIVILLCYAFPICTIHLFVGTCSCRTSLHERELIICEYT